MNNILITLIFTLSIASNANAAEANLFQVSLLRASPGDMPALIELVKETKAKVKGDMLIMRHSQGDHWDLMLLSPAEEQFPVASSYQSKADFQHDFLASCDCDWQAVREQSKGANLFHIEMFQAASGLYGKLLEQRHMENDYLVATERNANLVFETRFGSDVDLFTLGIYSDMLAFATDPDLAPEDFEKAAVEAGFKARSDIGFYLRRFLVGHQDTLATQIE